MYGLIFLPFMLPTFYSKDKWSLQFRKQMLLFLKRKNKRHLDCKYFSGGLPLFQISRVLLLVVLRANFRDTQEIDLVTQQSFHFGSNTAMIQFHQPTLFICLCTKWLEGLMQKKYLYQSMKISPLLQKSKRNVVWILGRYIFRTLHAHHDT